VSQTPPLQFGVGSAPDRRERPAQGSSPTLKSIAGIAALSVGLASVGMGPKTSALIESATLGCSQIVEGSASVIAPLATAAAIGMAEGPLMLVRAVGTGTDRAGVLLNESRGLREEYRAKRKELLFSSGLFSAICLASVLAILFGANPVFWTPIALGSLGVGGSSAIYLRRLGILGAEAAQ
jgi:hypothetical protein